MTRRIVKVNAIDDCHIHIWFDDGLNGKLNVKKLIGDYSGVFRRFNQPEFFRQVSINKESGTVEWPEGVDLDPYVLYSEITGEPIVWDGKTVYEPKVMK